MLDIRRRSFITLVGGAAAWPLTARAHQPTKVPTIGLFSPLTEQAQRRWTTALVERLGELGWQIVLYTAWRLWHPN